MSINHHKIISASILSANFAQLGKDVAAVLSAGADWIHIDVMDNHFVANLTFGPIISKSLRNYGITATFDVHLMVKPVDSLIAMFANAGANYITIHPESTENLINSLKLIKEYGCKAGIAINPNTSVDLINNIYQFIDLILIMSVNPGFAGQEFIQTSYNKIITVKNLIKNFSNHILLAVDGGINHENIGKLAQLGVDVFVVGSSVFKNNNYKENLNNLIQQIYSNI